MAFWVFILGENIKFLKKYKLLSLFWVLIFIGVPGRLIFGEDSLFWSIWGVLDTSSAVALAVLAFLAYKEIIKEDDENCQPYKKACTYDLHL